jgi:hypothetical protein
MLSTGLQARMMSSLLPIYWTGWMLRCCAPPSFNFPSCSTFFKAISVLKGTSDVSSGIIALEHLSDACGRLPAAFIRYSGPRDTERQTVVHEGSGCSSAIITYDFNDHAGCCALKTVISDEETLTKVSLSTYIGKNFSEVSFIARAA